MYMTADKIIKFVEETMKMWSVELTAGSKLLVQMKIQGGIFQGDVLSVVPFVFAIMTLNNILKKWNDRYKLHKLLKTSNPQMYTDDIKQLDKNLKKI